MPDIFTPAAILSLVTLTFLEVILGVDNVVFIAILAGKVPPPQQRGVRMMGLVIAMVLRIVMLASLVWLLRTIDITLLELPADWVGWISAPATIAEAQAFTVKDLILFLGGGFLIYQGTQEIREIAEPHVPTDAGNPARSYSLAYIIVQLFIINFVFSLDSVVTAIGMTQILWVMITAVVLSTIIMVWLAKPVGDFINRRPAVKVLALSFIMLIGLSLMSEAFAIHFPRGYIYFGIGFSLFVYALTSWVETRASITPMAKGDQRVH